MANADKLHFTVAQSAASDPGENAYIVVANAVGQHAIWPAARPRPAGWWPRSAALPLDACRTVVASRWPDITPAGIPLVSAVTSITSTELTTAPVPSPVPSLVPSRFAARADGQPGAAAVRGAAQLTYGGLRRSANQLAHALREMGVGPETVTGVGLERGADSIRALLGILTAGGGYLPMDPELPAARLAQMCDQAGARVILLNRAAEKAFAETKAQLVFVDELPLDGYPVTSPAVSLQPESIAYVISTSGSTGEPKAVAVSHGSLAAVISELVTCYQLSRRDQVLQMAPLSTDTSLEQIFVTLLAGATLVLPPPGPVAPSALLTLLGTEQVTVADLTPAYWHQILALATPADQRLARLRLAITGGDRADPEDCRAARRAAPGVQLINAYGLTETTITSALHDVASDPGEPRRGAPVPVGTPLRHAQVLVLGPDLAPVPAGETGEVYIGGRGVARGYLGQPDRTAMRFLPNPYSPEPGARMYRTGDLGRWGPGRHLEVLGRVDRQVKVRGYRVDPAEAEHVLTGHRGIADAAVTARELSPGDRQLIGYFVRRRTGPDEPRPTAGLRDFLAGQLPSFMIPAVFVEVTAIPRLPGGAPDEAALPSPPPASPVPASTGSAGTGSAGTAELTPAEAGMAHLWSRALGVPVTGLDDDFFELGGDSLKAAEMMAQARRIFGVSAADVRSLTRRLLRDPSLRGFSGAVQDARAGRLDPGVTGPRADFARESALEVPVRTGGGPPPRWRQPRTVLLTGATGFLGIHLLRELLADPGVRVHCLIRAANAAHAGERVIGTARRYGIGPLDLHRVVPLAGDLAQPGLGLSPVVFAELARAVDVIHHAGAQVNFIYPYEDLRAANVAGTRELIRLAGLSRGIPLHYISSTAVLAGFGAAGVRAVTEDTPLDHADQLGMGYIETKYVAEEMLRHAARAGLPVTIYRPLDVAGDHRTGAWNTATEMCALIRFIADTGLAPDIDLPLDFVPADLCAAAIRHIATHQPATGRTYHLASPRPAPLSALVERLRRHGFAVKAIPYPAWVDELLRLAVQDPAHPMAPFVPLFVDRCGSAGLTVAEMYLEHIFPAYTRAHTEQALDGSGIDFPPVDAALLDLHLSRLAADGYLRAPADRTWPGNQPLWRPAGTRTGTRSGRTRTSATARSRSVRI
jgi:amino acid adenylation domain-containing protein/thioester reductase-like protein